MKFTGEIQNVSRDWNTDTVNITFSVNEETALREIDSLKDSKLSIEAKKYREKRSLNANSYFHVLAGQLADALRISKPRCKNILLHRYGQPMLIDDTTQAVIKTNVPVSEMLELEEPHCFPCGTKTENGVELTFYKLYRGSHTYDTREMSILIDGTVDECKEQGIETMTPLELEHLKAMWGKKNG